MESLPIIIAIGVVGIILAVVAMRFVKRKVDCRCKILQTEELLQSALKRDLQRAHQHEKLVVVVAHFSTSYRELLAWLKQENIQAHTGAEDGDSLFEVILSLQREGRGGIVLVDGTRFHLDTRSKSKPPKELRPFDIVVSEPYPLPSRDDVWEQFLRLAPIDSSITLYISLESQFFRLHNAVRVGFLLERLRVSPQDELEHPLLYQVIRRMQRKNKKLLKHSEVEASSLAEWFEVNELKRK